MEEFLPVCAGIAILGLVAAIIYFLQHGRPFDYDKRKEGQNICLTIHARHNLDRVVVTAGFDTEEISFERKRIRKGQYVDFVFPRSDKKIRLSVTAEGGSTYALEIQA
jgi:hypothetical protein